MKVEGFPWNMVSLKVHHEFSDIGKIIFYIDLDQIFDEMLRFSPFSLTPTKTIPVAGRCDFLTYLFLLENL